MDQHRRIKISIRKHFGNATEMPPNLMAGNSIFRIVRFDFDSTAIGKEAKMVRRLQVVEAHDFVAACVHPLHARLYVRSE
jgi:hypothetical protein